MAGRSRRRNTGLVSDTTQVPVLSQKRDTTLVSRGWLRCRTSDAIDTTVVSRLTPGLTPGMTSFGRPMDVTWTSSVGLGLLGRQIDVTWTSARRACCTLANLELAALYGVFHRDKADGLSWAF